MIHSSIKAKGPIVCHDHNTYTYIKENNPPISQSKQSTIICQGKRQNYLTRQSSWASHDWHEIGLLLCHSFNHVWPLNIQNAYFLWIWKSIPHSQKACHMIMWYAFTSHMTQTKCYVMCQCYWSQNYTLAMELQTRTKV